MSPKQLPVNDKDDDDDDDDDDHRDNRRNHDNVDQYDDNGDLGQVVILSDPLNCNTLAVQATHHPHCPTERFCQKKNMPKAMSMTVEHETTWWSLLSS